MNSIQFHSQPIVCVKTGAAVAYELLLRTCGQLTLSQMQHSPQLYTQFMLPMVRAKVEHAYRILDRDSDAVIFLNFTPDQASQPEFEAILDTLSSSGIPSYKLALEITEKSDMAQHPRAVANIELARNRGFLIAVDDFGAGYSNIMNIIKLKPHIVKVDRLLLQTTLSNGIGREETRSGSLLGGLIRFLQTMKTKVVLEGIESEEQFNFAKRHGADFVQGYYLSKPGPIELTQPYHGQQGIRTSHQVV